MGRIAPVVRPRNPYTQHTNRYGNLDRSFNDPNSTLYNQIATNAATKPSATAPTSGDYTSNFVADPIIQKINALKDKTIEQARADALAARQQAILQSGNLALGKEFGIDQATLDAAAANPFSAEADIANQNAERQRQLNEYLNQNNLFYSSERERQLLQQATDRARAESDLNDKIRALFGDIGGKLNDAELKAQADALDRLQNVPPPTPPPTPPPGPPGEPPPVAAVTPNDYASPLHELAPLPAPAPIPAPPYNPYADPANYDDYGNYIGPQIVAPPANIYANSANYDANGNYIGPETSASPLELALARRRYI